MRRNGHVVGGINRVLHPTLRVFDKGYAVLAGSFGEIGRGYYWNGLADTRARLSAKGLLGRFDLPRDDRVQAALDHWLDDLASTDALHVLDLAYLEHRLGAWAAPQQAADPQLCLHPGPFQNLEIFDCLMSLPPQWRWRSLWIDHLLATRCPQLLSWPFNRHRETWRNALVLGAKVLSPDRIRRRVRRWLAD